MSTWETTYCRYCGAEFWGHPDGMVPCPECGHPDWPVNFWELDPELQQDWKEDTKNGV